MRFSVFLVGRSTAPEQDRFVMQSLIEHARQAEDRGFDAVFMPDHHFTGYAPMSSDPFVFAAYLAGQLKKIHFGMSVTTVPLHSLLCIRCASFAPCRISSTATSR